MLPVAKEKGSIDKEESGTKKKNSDITDQCPDGPKKPGRVKSENPIRKGAEHCIGIHSIYTLATTVTATTVRSALNGQKNYI